MAKLFSWMKFGKKKDEVTPKPAGSPLPGAALTPPVEAAEKSMKDAGKKPATKPIGTKPPTPKKITVTPAAKSAGTTKKTSPKKK